MYEKERRGANETGQRTRSTIENCMLALERTYKHTHQYTYIHTLTYIQKWVWVEFINVRSKTRYVHISRNREKRTHFDQNVCASELFGLDGDLHTCMYRTPKPALWDREKEREREAKDVAKKAYPTKNKIEEVRQCLCLWCCCCYYYVQQQYTGSSILRELWMRADSRMSVRVM